MDIAKHLQPKLDMCFIGAIFREKSIDENSFHLHYAICFESFEPKMRFDICNLLLESGGKN